MSGRRRRARAAARIIATVAGLALAVPATPAAAQQSAYEELQTFSGVLNYVRANYVDSVGYGALVRSAIQGMLEALDPHSVFLARGDDARLAAVARGELGTTGLSLEIVDGVATVLAVGPDAPAEKAGVLPGDRVLSVDGTPTAGLTAEGVGALLAGEKGSRAVLALERGARLEPTSLSIRVRREVYHWPDVARTAMLDSTTGYVRLSEFGDGAATAVRAAVRKLRSRGARRLVLDIRGNPGGLVGEAVQLASLFLPDGSLVFRTRGRKLDASQEYRTRSRGDFVDMPLVLLLDGGSASASEALAGALQDHDSALLVGRTSFGKALVQMDFPLASGDAVRLTIARVVTPSGRIIQRRYHGLTTAQYYALAGRPTAAADTATAFHTDHGRTVRGGGGIRPDIPLPPAPPPPAWWAAAADSGLAIAVADSVAATLPDSLRARWNGDEALWRDAVLEPFVARARAAFSIPARLPADAAGAAARMLAARVAAVRWSAADRDELLLRSDPDIAAALAAFARMDELRATEHPE